MDKELKFMVEKVLKRKTNVFLEEIENLMVEDGVGEVLSGKNNKGGKIPGRTQFKALMDATIEAACIEELLLFLSYQRSKGGGWDQVCRNRKNIAENLANSFMKIQDIIYEYIVEESKGKEIGDEEERLLRLEIARKYMGYIYWKVSVVSRY